jgi:hypothetical protein
MLRDSSSGLGSGPVPAPVLVGLDVADAVGRRGIGLGRIAFAEAESVGSGLEIEAEVEAVGYAVGSADTSPVAAAAGYEATFPDSANVAGCTPEQSLAGSRSVFVLVQEVADRDAWSG